MAINSKYVEDTLFCAWVDDRLNNLTGGDLGACVKTALQSRRYCRVYGKTGQSEGTRFKEEVTLSFQG